MKKAIIRSILFMSMCVFFFSCRKNVEKSEANEIMNSNEHVTYNETEVSKDAKKLAEETKKASEDALNKAKQMVEEIKKEK